VSGADRYDSPYGPSAAPTYVGGGLCELMPSIASRLGVDAYEDRLGLADRLDGARSVCVLLVDGLGSQLLARDKAAAPYLTSLDGESGRTLSAGFPSTTASSLGSLGTGLVPGRHGLLGYRVRIPETAQVLNQLKWDVDVDPLQWQPSTTVFERAATAGVAVTRVGPSVFAGTGFTRAALRGGAYAGANSHDEMVTASADALRAGDRALVYAYVGAVDTAGHAHGSASDQWLSALGDVDRLAERLAAVLPTDGVLVISADHGMVDVPDSEKVDIDAKPELLDGVAVVAGEPRARYVHALPGAVDDVRTRWAEILGAGWWVLRRDDAVERGWFGDVEPAMRARIGDIVAVPRGGGAVVAGTSEALEARLVGYHGALTEAERLVPLLVARP
jgi:hypothetical protein